MLHDRQGSIGIFGPYGYLIAAVDIAASADTTARSHITGETESTACTTSMVKSVVSALRNIVASIITKPERAYTA